MSNGFKAPVGDSKKLDNVELIHPGSQLCTLYSMCDIGTQDGGNFGPKHKINFAFEFPQHMRVFYEGDDPKPSAIFCTETFSMAESANLRKKWVQPMIGKVLTDDQAAEFDISSLLGKHFVATIVHSPDGKWANIQSISPLDDRNMLMFSLPSPNMQQINPTSFFALSQGFESNAFANLPNFLRDKVMASEEAKKHKASGGKFAEQATNTSSSGNASSPTPPASSNGLVWLSKDYTYETMKAGGWTDEQLIANGYAKKNEPVAPPAPVAAPAPPVQTPQPPQAPAAPAPVAEKQLVFKDPNAQPLEAWLKSGWTVENIVSQGHATFQ